MESMQSLFKKFVQNGDIFICDFIVAMKVYQGQLHTLYSNIAYAFQNDEFWSFYGLLQNDHEQIHMKWVFNYDKNCIKHFAFVSNNENTLVRV
jgi:hypothetical protein